jgi:hypothetical protein
MIHTEECSKKQFSVLLSDPRQNGFFLSGLILEKAGNEEP